MKSSKEKIMKERATLEGVVKEAARMVSESKRAVWKRCLLEGCRYGIEGIDKEPLDRCIYCGEKRPQLMPNAKETNEK